MDDGWPADAQAQGGAHSSLLGRICAACVRSVPVTGAAVSLVTGAGHRATVHASDGVAARLKELHSDLGEGPGLDAFRECQPVLVPDLGEPGRGVGGRYVQYRRRWRCAAGRVWAQEPWFVRSHLRGSSRLSVFVDQPTGDVGSLDGHAGIATTGESGSGDPGRPSASRHNCRVEHQITEVWASHVNRTTDDRTRAVSARRQMDEGRRDEHQKCRSSFVLRHGDRRCAAQ